MRYFNRKVAWTPHGITYEADEKHTKLVLAELGMSDGHPVSTPGVHDKISADDEGQLSLAYQGKLRRVIAILNYLRPGLAYALKECAREMAAPSVGTERKVKRVARFLRRRGREVLHFDWQHAPEPLLAQSDSDWAGCQKSRRSKSGGAIYYGSHLLTHWSKTQTKATLSPGEAELGAQVKASTELLGLRNLAAKLGSRLKLAAETDSAATRGMVHRIGTGRLKHVEAGLAWIQGRTARGDIRCNKINRDTNIAGLLTQHCAERDLTKHLRQVGISLLP